MCEEPDFVNMSCFIRFEDTSIAFSRFRNTLQCKQEPASQEEMIDFILFRRTIGKQEPISQEDMVDFVLFRRTISIVSG